MVISTGMVIRTQSLVLYVCGVACAIALIAPVTLHAVGTAADKQCTPFYRECTTCGMKPNPDKREGQPKCIRGENKNNCICTDTTNKFSTIGTCVRDGVCEGKTAGNLDGKQTNLTDPKNTPWSAYSGAGIGSSVGEWGVFGSDPAFNDSSGFDEGNNPALDSDPGESWEPQPEQRDTTQQVNTGNTAEREIGLLSSEPMSGQKQELTGGNATAGELSPIPSGQQTGQLTGGSIDGAQPVSTTREAGVSQLPSDLGTNTFQEPFGDVSEKERADQAGTFQSSGTEKQPGWRDPYVEGMTNIPKSQPPGNIPENHREVAEAITEFGGILCKLPDCDTKTIQQATGGSYKQESQWEEDVTSPGGKYKGVSQLSDVEVKIAVRNGEELLKSGTLNQNERALVQEVVDYARANKDAINDPYYGAALGMLRQSNFSDIGKNSDGSAINGMQVASDYAEGNPQLAAAVYQLAQLAPSALRDFDENAALTPNQLSALKNNYVSVGSGDTVGDAIDAMAYGRYSSNFAAGISQYNAITAATYQDTGFGAYNPQALSYAPVALMGSSGGLGASFGLNEATSFAGTYQASSVGDFSLAPVDTPVSFTFAGTEQTGLTGGYTGPGFSSDVFSGQTPGAPGFAYAPSDSVFATAGSYLGTGEMLGTSPAATTLETAQGVVPSGQLSAETIPFDSRWANSGGQYEIGQRDLSSYNTANQYIQQQPGYAAPPTPAPGIDILAEPGYAAPSTPAPGIDIPTEPGYATPATPAPGLDIPVEPGYIETNDVVGNAPVGRVEQGADLPPPQPSLWERTTGALSGVWSDVREWWTGGDVLGGAPAGSVTSAGLPDVPTNVPNIPAELGYAAPPTPAPGIDIPTEPGYATPATPAPGMNIPAEPGYAERNDVVGNAPVGRVEQGADLPPIKQTWGEWANEKFTNIGDTLKGELGRWGRAYEILTSGTFGTQEPAAPTTGSALPSDTMAIETGGASNPPETSGVTTESPANNVSSVDPDATQKPINPDIDTKVRETFDAQIKNAKENIAFAQELLARSESPLAKVAAQSALDEANKRLDTIVENSISYAAGNPSTKLQEAIDRIANNESQGVLSQAFSGLSDKAHAGAADIKSMMSGGQYDIFTQKGLADLGKDIWHGSAWLMAETVGVGADATKGLLERVGAPGFQATTDQTLVEAIDPYAKDYKIASDVAMMVPFAYSPLKSGVGAMLDTSTGMLGSSAGRVAVGEGIESVLSTGARETALSEARAPLSVVQGTERAIVESAETGIGVTTAGRAGARETAFAQGTERAVVESVATAPVTETGVTTGRAVAREADSIIGAGTDVAPAARTTADTTTRDPLLVLGDEGPVVERSIPIARTPEPVVGNAPAAPAVSATDVAVSATEKPWYQRAYESVFGKSEVKPTPIVEEVTPIGEGAPPIVKNFEIPKLEEPVPPKLSSDVSPNPTSPPTLADESLNSLRGPAPGFDLKPVMEINRPTGPRIAMAENPTLGETSSGFKSPWTTSEPVFNPWSEWTTAGKVTTGVVGAGAIGLAVLNSDSGDVKTGDTQPPTAEQSKGFFSQIWDGFKERVEGRGRAEVTSNTETPAPTAQSEITTPPTTTTPPPTTPPPTTPPPATPPPTPPPAAPPPNTPPPQTPPPSQQQPPAPPPTTPPPSGQSGNGFSGMLGGLSQMLGQMLGKLLGNNQQQQGTGQTTPTTPATTTIPTTPSMQAIASLIADPSRTTAGNSVRLVWASVGTIGCSMKDSAGAQISSGSSDGFIRTEALATTTAFTLSCVTSLGGSVSASTTVIVTPAATTTTATTTTSN